MEIDNGAEESLINETTFKQIWPDSEPKWLKRQSNLRAWGKRPIAVKGTTIVHVEYKGIRVESPIVVTEENSGPNLFGEN